MTSMRVWMLAGGFALGVLACSASSGFACTEDSECSLSGEPGVCSGGNCAYPSDECDSGYAFPDGAPGSLAGTCADVDVVPGSTGQDTGPGLSSGPGVDTGDSTGGTTVALDDGTTTSDDTTSSPMGTSLGSSDGETTDGSSSGGCNSVELFVDPIADAFMTEGCAMMGCVLLNNGAADQHPIGLGDNDDQSVMAIRFDTKELIDSGISEVQSAELELSFELDDNNIAGTIRVSVLTPEVAWVEGSQIGSLAELGESCWAWAQFQLVEWPEGDPLSAIVADVGQLDVDGPPEGKALAIPLDPAELTGQVLSGANSLLVYGDISPDAMFVFSRESGLGPRLHLTGC